MSILCVPESRGNNNDAIIKFNRSSRYAKSMEDPSSAIIVLAVKSRANPSFFYETVIIYLLGWKEDDGFFLQGSFRRQNNHEGQEQNSGI